MTSTASGILRHLPSISPTVAVATVVFALMAMACIAAPLIAPQDPYNLALINLYNARTPPMVPNEFTGEIFLLGSDDQGRDILSTVLYGGRLSLFIGFAAVALATALGGTLGLLAGYVDGWVDSVIMRIADVQLAMPGFLIALFIVGVVTSAGLASEGAIMGVLILSIGLSEWVQFARVARAATMVQKRLEYVEAARIAGISPLVIMFRHLLVNIAGPMLVIAPVALAASIQLEATISFLGVGMPPTRPSLGTLINIGRDYLFSGESWITLFPAVTLIVLVISVNFFGDWLRESLNPKLR